MTTESRLSVHLADNGSYFYVAYGYVKASDLSPETCRVSPFYTSPVAAVTAYHEKRAEYGEV